MKSIGARPSSLGRQCLCHPDNATEKRKSRAYDSWARALSVRTLISKDTGLSTAPEISPLRRVHKTFIAAAEGRNEGR